MSDSAEGGGVAGLLASAAAGYRKMFGWPAKVAGDAVVVEMSGGVGGVVVPQEYCPALISALADVGCLGPVLAPPAGAERLVFLADPNGSVVPSQPIPPGARVLTKSDLVPLPAGPVPRISARWAVQPVAGDWLPLLDTVLGVLAGVYRGDRARHTG
ncbi:MAG TPA: hypothetical protein VJX66_05535 [Amycolatopsis sp.]|nr:hypothetical protein [Amycolatopsis sp.]